MFRSLFLKYPVHNVPLDRCVKKKKKFPRMWIVSRVAMPLDTWPFRSIETGHCNSEFVNFFQEMEKEDSFASLLDDSFSDNDEVLEDHSEDHTSILKISFSCGSIHILRCVISFIVQFPWPSVYNALENLSKNFEEEHLQQALQQCLSSCPIDSLDEKIFSKILPLAHHFLMEVNPRYDIPLNINTFTVHVNDALARQCVDNLSINILFRSERVVIVSFSINIYFVTYTSRN